MRTFIIFTAATITTTVLAYHFVRDNAVPIRAQVAISQNATASGDLDIQHKLDKLAHDLLRYQQTHEEQLQQATSEQVRLSNLLVELDSRIRSVETLGNEQPTKVPASNRDVQIKDKDKDKDSVASNNASGNPKLQKLSETDLGHWVDESLVIGYLDENLTAQAAEQAATSLTKMPGINLEDMQCAERICRATFTNENNESAIQDLMGEPPFINEGFTITEADGRTLFYFTQPGVSLAELRSEAQ